MASKIPQVRLSKPKVELAMRDHPERITQQRLADRIGVDETLMSRYMNGSRTIPVDRAVRLADWLRVPLMTLTDDGADICPACGQVKVAGVAA